MLGLFLIQNIFYTGGMFDYVSGANFFGEVVEWCGFALACYSLPALAFAMFAAFNLGPRATSHHRQVRGLCKVNQGLRSCQSGFV
jgi:hypothetical protein